jgi:hypothetical protein
MWTRTNTLSYTLLLDERDKDRVALNLARQARLDGLDPDCSHDQEMAKYLRNHMEYDRKYVLAGTARNDFNRQLHRSFSESVFPIHQNNFAMYCKPHLQKLPPDTAVALQKQRMDLKDGVFPPYRPIQLDVLPELTVPTFAVPLGASKAPPPLLPRAR